MLKPTLLSIVFAFVLSASAQDGDNGQHSRKKNIAEGLHYEAELQASVADGVTPLWLNANRYGLSSLEGTNGYLRGALIRPLSNDSASRWGIGYGVDIALPCNYTSDIVVQQAYAEVRWLHGVLTVGSKQQPMELKNSLLSSGSQTLGINARPVPQVRLALPDYWCLPFANGWLHLKGHVAYGMMTDDNWQHEVTRQQTKYADHVLYHSKAGYLKIGNEDVFSPWSLELGLEMACLFGGTPYRMLDGELVKVPTGTGFKDFLNAFLPGGSDPGEGLYGNVEGNHLGSWVFRLNHESDTWSWSVYGDHFFEDHSQMFLLDYNGYGKGEEFNVRKDNRYFMYALKDMMLGAELSFRYGSWIKGIVLEYIYTKYQSGPYNHDRTVNIPDHIAGTDNYYNHSIYPGYQHWGQVMGNPLYRSPLYNGDGTINVDNNRFVAFHLGLCGQPTSRLDYRMMATWQAGWGTYDNPYTRKHHNVSLMLQGNYRFPGGWKAGAALGADFGYILGHNYGMQLTVAKSGIIGEKKRKGK